METIRYFRNMVAEAANLSIEARRIAQRYLSDVGDLMNGPNSEKLTYFIMDRVAEFEFPRVEEKLYQELDRIVGEHLALVRRSIDDPESSPNYNALVAEMIEQLKKLKHLDLHLDEEFNQLANSVAIRFELSDENLFYYMRTRRMKIEEAIREKNDAILDSLIRLTPNLFEELRVGVDAERKRHTVVKLLIVPDGHYYIDAETAAMVNIPCKEEYHCLSVDEYYRLRENYQTIVEHIPLEFVAKKESLTVYVTVEGKYYISKMSANKLGIPCEEKYHWLNLNEHRSLKEQYLVKYEPTDEDLKVHSDAEPKKKKTSSSITSATIYFDAANDYYITNEMAIALGLTSSKSDDMFPLSQEQFDDITSRIIIDLKPIMHKEEHKSLSEKERIVVYYDELGNHYISSVDALRLGLSRYSAGDYRHVSTAQIEALKEGHTVIEEAMPKKTKQSEKANDASQKEEDRITVYVDQAGDRYIEASVAQKFVFPLHTFNNYHLLRDEEFEIVCTKSAISETSILMDRELADESIEHPKDSQPNNSNELENRPVVMIYVGPDGRLYKQVPVNIDKVETDKLGAGLSPDEMTSIMEYADIVWVKFDDFGGLSDATDLEIDSIINYYLGAECSIVETASENGVHRYKVDYMAVNGPLPTDKIV